jgi:hypothetical protein
MASTIAQQQTTIDSLQSKIASMDAQHKEREDELLSMIKEEKEKRAEGAKRIRLLQARIRRMKRKRADLPADDPSPPNKKML